MILASPSEDSSEKGNQSLDFPHFAAFVHTMVKTSKTDHFIKLAPFRSPLTDLIDLGMAGELLTSATRRCSAFVDSVLHI